MQAERCRGMLHVHLSAVLFGGTALFAKWITLPPAVTTFWRTVVALLVVWLVLLLSIDWHLPAFLFCRAYGSDD